MGNCSDGGGGGIRTTGVAELGSVPAMLQTGPTSESSGNTTCDLGAGGGTALTSAGSDVMSKLFGRGLLYVVIWSSRSPY